MDARRETIRLYGLIFLLTLHITALWILVWGEYLEDDRIKGMWWFLGELPILLMTVPIVYEIGKKLKRLMKEVRPR